MNFNYSVLILFLLLSHVQLFATPWTVLCDPMDCSLSGSSVHGQEYWSGLPFPSPADFPDPGTEPMSLMSPALAGGFFTTIAAWKAPACVCYAHIHIRTHMYICLHILYTVL